MQLAFCGPAHALMFSSYEHVLTLGGTAQTSRSEESQASGQRVAAIGFIAGAVSTALHDLVMVPADTVKQRLQLGYYRGPLHCLRRTKFESLYRSLPTTLATNIPFGGIMIASNESIKQVVNPSGEFSLSVYMLSAGVSGALAGWQVASRNACGMTLGIKTSM